jgi:rubrerythrin
MPKGKIPKEKIIADVLIFAVHKEESAIRFYSRLAEQIQDAEATLVFLNLARDEGIHRQTLEQWWRNQFNKPFPFDINMVDERKAEIDSQAGALAALDLALEAEEASAKHYVALAKLTKDKKLAKLCTRLADEEWGHFETINAEKNAIIESFYWFDVDHSAYLED